jgi:hypothetical protein
MLIKIILCLICLILWILIQYTIIKIIMTKVSNSAVRYDLIILLRALEIVVFICGTLLGLINC